MNTDPFDEVFGPGRGVGQPNSPERELAELQAWLKQTAHIDERVVSVIQHAGQMVEVTVRVCEDESAHETSYEWWFPVDHPAGRWLLDMGMRDDAILIDGWDYVAEQHAAQYEQ